MSLLDSLIEAELALPPTVVGTDAKREIWICLRTDGVIGLGTQDDPLDGSTAAKFDAAMRFSPSGATIRIGPGAFETKGGSPAGWQLKQGHIIGSGMFVTTLKLIDYDVRGWRCSIITGPGSGLDGVEISDLTLDCNIAGMPVTSPDTYARVQVSGIYLYGSNHAIRRVRCINWGTQTPLWEWSYPTDGTSNWECFPILVQAGSLSADNNVVEDCIIEQPGQNNARESTCINTGSRNGTIRNCLVNGGLPGKSPGINSVTFDGSSPYLVTVVFNENHNKTTDSHVLMYVYKGGTTVNPLSGYFKVHSVPNATTLTYYPQANPDLVSGSVDAISSSMGPSIQGLGADSNEGMVVEGNRIVGCSVGGPYHDTARTVSLFVRNNVYRDVYLGIYSADGGSDLVYFGDVGDGVIAKSGGNAIYTVAGGGTHPLSTGDLALVTSNPSDAYCGMFAVTRIDSHQFSYIAPASSPGASQVYSYRSMRAGTLSDVSNPSHPEYNVRLTMPSTKAHGCRLGDLIEVSGPVNSSGTQTKLGVFKVSHITNAYTLEWKMASVPSFGGSSYWFTGINSTDFYVAEDNIIDLGYYPRWGYSSPPAGISLLGAGPPQTDPWLYGQVIVRGNIIRHTDGVADATSAGAVGVVARCAETAIIENNIVTLETPGTSHAAAQPINYGAVRSFKAFNNQDAEGTLLNPKDWVEPDGGGPIFRGLEGEADDWLVMYLIN